jgi:hypothetical protein
MISGSLIVTHPDGHKRLFPLGIHGIRIGSASDNDIVISGPGVLPYHAMISCERHDVPVIYISSGALPHRTRTASSLPQALRSGAIVPIGQFMLAYQAVDLNAGQISEPIIRQEATETSKVIINTADTPAAEKHADIPLLQRWLVHSARPKPRQLSPLVRSIALS